LSLPATEWWRGISARAKNFLLAFASLGADIPSAVANVYAAVDKIRWDGIHYRKDIGRQTG